MLPFAPITGCPGGDCFSLFFFSLLFNVKPFLEDLLLAWLLQILSSEVSVPTELR